MTTTPIRIEDGLYDELWDRIDSKHKTISSVIRGLVDRDKETKNE